MGQNFDDRETLNTSNELNTEEQQPRKEAGNVFSQDSMLSIFLMKVGTIVLANIYFILCCIPLVTIGASITSLIRVCELINAKSDFHLTKVFFKTFKENFINATFGWLIFGSIFAGCIYGIIGITRGEPGNLNAVLIGLLGVVAFVDLIEITFFFPLLTHFENTIGNHMKNALLIGIINLWRTISVWIVWAIPIVAFVFSIELIRYLGWIWMVAGFTLFTIVSCEIFKKVFDKYKPVSDDK